MTEGAAPRSQPAIIKRDRVRVTTGRVPGHARRASAACAPTKGARLLRADGVVRAIEITCSCGETTVLELEFEPEETS